MIRLLGNRNFIFLMAVGFGLALPGPAAWTALVMIPVS